MSRSLGAPPTELTVDDTSLNRRIAPNDEMFSGDEAFYFAVGRSALECIVVSLRAAHKPPETVRRILDLPCGHGRVLRYLRAGFPDAEITACDLLRDGVDFCAEAFGAIPVYSTEDAGTIPIEGGAFDVVWTGSLLTHVDSPLWLPFLTALSSFLDANGCLIVSTHGRQTCDLMRSGLFDFGLSEPSRATLVERFERDGFGYVDYEGRARYGVSVSSPSWVLSQLGALPQLRVVHVSESSWAGHQDIYACVRDPERQGAVAPRPVAPKKTRGFVRAVLDVLSRVRRKGAR